jgi:uncharacterized protein YcbX
VPGKSKASPGASPALAPKEPSSPSIAPPTPVGPSEVGPTNGRVQWVTIAPVKGLGLAHPKAVELDKGGVTANRAFFLIDERGQLVNGKRLGTLVTVSPTYNPTLNVLSMAFPDGATVRGEVSPGRAITTSFFGRPVLGHVVEGPWSEALSNYFARKLVLVKVAEVGHGVDRGPKGSVTVLSEASVGRLSKVLGISHLDPRRFRMLFGVNGLPAHAEDDWLGHLVRIGTAVISVVGLVGRCLVTSQNPDSGLAGLDTLGALRKYRLNAGTGEKLPFGVWATVAQPGRVALGDEVEPIGVAPRSFAP